MNNIQEVYSDLAIVDLKDLVPVSKRETCSKAHRCKVLSDEPDWSTSGGRRYKGRNDR